ncbi:MAG: ATPase [Sphingobium sp.]|nr:ATPase [Sphingobium sp.]
MFVITGGPGSGKTSLIEALAQGAYINDRQFSAPLLTMPETGRAIIQDQIAIGGTALPWADRNAFAELMLSWACRSYREAMASKGPVVLDRGIADIMGYLMLCNLPVPAHMRRAAELYRYNPLVFIAPHWPDIYVQDAERKQDERLAEATCRMMGQVYTNLGYDVVPLPLVSVQERADFVRAHIAAA